MATAKKAATRTVAKKVAVKQLRTSADVDAVKGMSSKTKNVLKEALAASRPATAAELAAMRDKEKAPAKKPATKKAVKAEAPVAKQTKEERAVEKLAELERNELLYRATSVLVPIWFGNANAEKVMKTRQLSAEEAICIMFIGSTQGGASEQKIRMNLHMRSGFNRREAMLIGYWGMSSLIGSKLGKWVGSRDKMKTDEQRDSQKMVLTAKGQKIYDTARKSILSGFEPKRALKHTYF